MDTPPGSSSLDHGGRDCLPQAVGVEYRAVGRTAWRHWVGAVLFCFVFEKEDCQLGGRGGEEHGGGRGARVREHQEQILSRLHA